MRKELVRKQERSGAVARDKKEKSSSGGETQETRGIWSAKREEFPRVALSVTSIDTSVYHRRGVWLERGCEG